MKYRMMMSLAGVGLALASAGLAHADLLALYRFEDLSGVVNATIADSTANNRDLTVHLNDVTLGPGQVGNSITFNGTNAIGGDVFGGTDLSGDFTYAFWIKVTNPDPTANANQYIGSFTGGGAGGQQTSLIYDYVPNAPSDQLVELFGVQDGSVDLMRPDSGLAVTDSVWHHVVYTRTGTDFDKYLDGVKTDIPGGDFTTFSKPWLVLGAADVNHGSSPRNGLSGLLDDVAIFDGGLDQSQVDAIMGGDFFSFGIGEPGDVTGDGVAGPADFAIIRQNFGLSGQMREQGDLTGDGEVGFADFREWKANRTSSALSVNGVPEPSTFVMLSILLASGLMVRRQARV